MGADRDRPRPRGTVLYVALRAIDNLKLLFTPFLPFSSQALHELLGYDTVIAGARVRGDRRRRSPYTSSPATTTRGTARWEPSALPPGQALREPKPLFVKLDAEQVVEGRARAHAGRARA